MAAFIPEIPAPITMAAFFTSISMLSSASEYATRLMPARINPAAFTVASRGRSLWGQEHCSRIFT
jgi:hypothetical protein